MKTVLKVFGNRSVFACTISVAITACTNRVFATEPRQPSPPERSGRLVISDEAGRDNMSGFVPSGYMPDGNGLGLRHDWSDNPHSGKTCLQVTFDAKRPWAGVYWLAGGQWGTEPGVDVYKAIGANKGDKIKLSFWGRADDRAVIECKSGGVSSPNQKYRDSIPFPVSTGDITLTPQWTEHTITLTDKDCSSLVGGFCFVLTAAKNDRLGRNEGKQVVFFLDDIVIERETAPVALADVVSRVRWIAYTPTEYDPTSKPRKIPSEESIRNDLSLLRERFDGIVTYGCEGGLERIPRIAARDLGFAVIQGQWNPDSRVEHDNIVALAKEGLITAVCCGNEGLNERYTFAVLQAEIKRLREETGLPVTTSEQIEDYGDDKLIQISVDGPFLMPICHPVWREIHDVKSALAWVEQQVQELTKAAGPSSVILWKETGWPAGSSTNRPEFTPDAQAEFWRGILRIEQEHRARFCVFEAFSVHWKNTEVLPNGASIGQHWNIFDSAMRARPAVKVFEPLKK